MEEEIYLLILVKSSSQKIGVLGRIMDRGSRSINFVLNSMIFNVFPTLLGFVVCDKNFFLNNQLFNLTINSIPKKYRDKFGGWPSYI